MNTNFISSVVIETFLWGNLDGCIQHIGAFPLWKLLGTENSIIVEKNKSSGANRSYFDYIFQNFEVQLKYKTHRSPGFFFLPR